ncbi:MAG: DUF2157 domain-containing protein [Deltaproteobacteria bacterium]|nr:DUF2157 domain-containing protein [Deltaproteobacteria bacterium]
MVDRPRSKYEYRRFSDCSVSEKLINSLFLITIGVGYLLAITYLYTSHEKLDHKSGLSVDDVAYTYHGNRSGTVLESALRGKMSGYIDTDSRDLIIQWIYDGTPEKEYQERVMPILESYCMACHGDQSGMNLVGLFTPDDIRELTRMDTGKSIGELAKVSHIHLFGIGIILFLIGRIFILCEMPITLKRIIVILPFAAIAMDIGSWWITHWFPFFAYVVIFGGALIGFSMAFQIFTSLYFMWFYKYPQAERSDE